ncbi:MAG: hypothetical protein R2749_22980 [Acidimicrobiales bacterium]
MSFGASMYAATSTRLQHVADPGLPGPGHGPQRHPVPRSTPVGRASLSAVSDATNLRVAVGLGGVGGARHRLRSAGARRRTELCTPGTAGIGSGARTVLDVAVKSEG